jgi:hypothetical protein
MTFGELPANAKFIDAETGWIMIKVSNYCAEYHFELIGMTPSDPVEME